MESVRGIYAGCGMIAGAKSAEKESKCLFFVDSSLAKEADDFFCSTLWAGGRLGRGYAQQVRISGEREVCS